ncbi:MAG: DUF1963 domain-containing protein [Pirellulaceae bacterium]|nr:DUF1963 domain-containing protein [Pirellulaceae bacterium]
MSSLEEFRRANTRRATVLTIGGLRPTRNPLATHFGLAPVASSEESWPYVGDRPLFFICQLNLTEAPFVPERLRDLALLTVFMDMEARRLGRENGDGWLVRSYATLEGLRPLAIPAGATVPRGFEVRYELAEDHPVYDDPELKVVPGFNRNGVHLENIHRTKMGGYASNIQSEQWWWYTYTPEEMLPGHPSEPRYCFQIASEDKVGLYWGDNGILYFARGTAPDCETQWFLDTQCY